MNLQFMQSMEDNTRANTSTLLTKRSTTASRIPVSQKCTNKLFPRKENKNIDFTQKSIPVKRREFRSSTNDSNSKEDICGLKTSYASKKGRFANQEISNVKQDVQADVFVWKTEKEDRASYSKDDMLLWMTPVPYGIPSEPQKGEMFRKTKTKLGEDNDITTNGNAFDEILSTMNTDHGDCLESCLNEKSNNDHSEVKSLENKNHEQVLAKNESSTTPTLRPHLSTMFENVISNHDTSFDQRECGLSSERQLNANERSPKDERSWENKSRHKEEDISGYQVDRCEHKGNRSGYKGDRYQVVSSGYDVDRSGYKEDKSGHVDGSGYKEDKSGYHVDKGGYNEDKRGYHVDRSGYKEDKMGHQENSEKDKSARQGIIRRHSMFSPHRSDLRNEIEKERDENAKLQAQIEKLSSFIESSEDLRDRCETLLAQQKNELEKEISEKEILKTKVCCLEELRRNVQRKLDVETEEKKLLKKTIKDIEVKLYEEREKVKVIKKECSSEISKNVELEIVLQTVLEELGSANKLLDVRTLGDNGLVWGKTAVPSYAGITPNRCAKYGVDYNKIRQENYWNREKNQFEGKIKLLEMDKNKLHSHINVLQEKSVQHQRIGCNLRENNDVLEFRITELQYQVFELSKEKNNDALWEY